MAKTHLDQLVNYPAKIIQKIAEDRFCVGLLRNKNFDQITEEDCDEVLDKDIFDYQYVDNTTLESKAYIWIEVDIDRVQNEQIKDATIYVVVACHKGYMKLNHATFRGIVGNRRDNLVRYIDRLLNGSTEFGIGGLKLKSVRPINLTNGFTGREISYQVPDFNIRDVDE